MQPNWFFANVFGANAIFPQVIPTSNRRLTQNFPVELLAGGYDGAIDAKPY